VFDDDGNLYVLDDYIRIIMIEKETGYASIITGAEVKYTNIRDFCLDQFKNIYIIDNCKIRKYSSTTQKVSTIGGGNSCETVDGYASVSRFSYPKYIYTTDNGYLLLMQDDEIIRKLWYTFTQSNWKLKEDLKFFINNSNTNIKRDIIIITENNRCSIHTPILSVRCISLINFVS